MKFSAPVPVLFRWMAPVMTPPKFVLPLTVRVESAPVFVTMPPPRSVPAPPAWVERPATNWLVPFRFNVPPALTARALLKSSVFVTPEARFTVPLLMAVVPLTNCCAFRFSVPGRAFVKPAVPVKAEVTLRVWPAWTWMRPSAPRATIGTFRNEVVPVPLLLARMAPLVSVRVAGGLPPRPPTATVPLTLSSVRALMVWLEVSEFSVAGPEAEALKVCVGATLRILVAAA